MVTKRVHSPFDGFAILFSHVYPTGPVFFFLVWLLKDFFLKTNEHFITKKVSQIQHQQLFPTISTKVPLQKKQTNSSLFNNYKEEAKNQLANIDSNYYKTNTRCGKTPIESH